MMHIHQLIAEHGAYFYALVLIWTFLEGETVVLFAGFAASQGFLHPELLLPAAWLGSFAGDQCGFWLGRHFGKRLLGRFPRWRPGVDAALYWVERYNTGFILTFRFIYGVRNISSFALGMSAVGWQRFLRLNLLAAGLWAACFVGVGYFLGNVLRAAMPQIARSFRLSMLAALIVVGGATWLLHRLKRRRPRVPPGARIATPPPGE
jgi:membrane protein DedA with SNARE-associated domain